VPHPWDVMPDRADYEGLAWYRRRLTPPAAIQDAHLGLPFPAVFYLAHVWLNGEYLGFPEVCQHARHGGRLSDMWPGIQRHASLYRRPSPRGQESLGNTREWFHTVYGLPGTALAACPGGNRVRARFRRRVEAS
jgi:hypothetical protein